MAKLDLSCVRAIDVQKLIKDLVQWQDELESNIFDNIVYETLDSVIDLIIDSCEEI